MVEIPNLGLVNKAPRSAICDDRIVIPAIPQATHDLNELFSAFVTQLMVGMNASEVAPAGGGRRGNRIPSRPSAADVVERGESPRHGEGLAVGRRHGRAESDILGGHGDCREHGQRLEADRIGRVIVKACGQTIPDEQQVEKTALCNIGDALDNAQILKTRVGARIAPPGRVVSRAQNEDAKVHFLAHVIRTVVQHANAVNSCTFCRAGPAAEVLGLGPFRVGLTLAFDVRRLTVRRAIRNPGVAVGFGRGIPGRQRCRMDLAEVFCISSLQVH